MHISLPNIEGPCCRSVYSQNLNHSCWIRASFFLGDRTGRSRESCDSGLVALESYFIPRNIGWPLRCTGPIEKASFPGRTRYLLLVFWTSTGSQPLVHQFFQPSQINTIITAIFLKVKGGFLGLHNRGRDPAL